MSDDPFPDSVPVDDFLQQVFARTPPEVCALKAERYKARMTQKALAAVAKLKVSHISEMEHGKRPIGTKVAQRLAKALGCDWRMLVTPSVAP